MKNNINNVALKPNDKTGKHWLVAWSNNVRHAFARDHRQACYLCYGCCTVAMVSEQIPTLPRKMPVKKCMAIEKRLLKEAADLQDKYNGLL